MLIEGSHKLCHKHDSPPRNQMTLDTPEAIGRRIKTLRLAKGYDVAAEFARVVGWSPQQLNNYERGLRLIHFHEAMKLVALTGVSLDWLMWGAPGTLRDDLQQLISAYERHGRNGNGHQNGRRSA
jgi:transcriptional regulator with XRE-family HTH domain